MVRGSQEMQAALVACLICLTVTSAVASSNRLTSQPSLLLILPSPIMPTTVLQPTMVPSGLPLQHLGDYFSSSSPRPF